MPMIATRPRRETPSEASESTHPGAAAEGAAMSNNTAFVLIVLGSIAAGTALVIAGHPWFALMVIVLGGSVSFNSPKSK